MLPRLDGQDVWRALARFPPRTGHGGDTLRPGDLRLAPPQAREELALLFGLAEDLGTWPWQLLMVIFFLAPKGLDADRAIGLLSMVIRVWAKIRRALVRAWSREQSGHWGRALQGSSALRIAMMRACWVEANLELKQEVAMALVDIEGFFDHIPLLGLWARAVRMRYPVRVLALSFALYVCPRLIKWNGW